MDKGLKIFLWIVGLGLVAYVGYRIVMANRTPDNGPSSTDPLSDRPNVDDAL